MKEERGILWLSDPNNVGKAKKNRIQVIPNQAIPLPQTVPEINTLSGRNMVKILHCGIGRK